MATLPPFASADDVAAWSGGAIQADDVRIDPALQSVSAQIRAFLGWHLAPSLTETLLLDGPGGHVVSLPSMHVTAISSVVENDVTLTVEPHESLTLDDYQWSQLGELRRDPGFWPSSYRGLSVSLTHGFDLDSAAYAIAHSVALSAVSRAVLAPASGVVREQTLVSSITYASAGAGVSGGSSLMPHELAALTPWQIRGV